MPPPSRALAVAALVGVLLLVGTALSIERMNAPSVSPRTGSLASEISTTLLGTSESQSASSSATHTTETSSLLAGLQAGSIGYVGCSNTEDSVNGYYMVPTNAGLFWRPYATGGGSLDLWANRTSHYWALFNQEVQRYGQPKVVWIEMCERAAAPLTFSMVQQTISILKQNAPGATYYVSPLNSYNPSNMCGITGPNGVTDTSRLVNQTTAAGLALAGPILGPLTAQNTQSDLCHPNSSGEMLLGQQLATFFDR